MIHHVFANKSNIGDWLSARGIQDLLRPLKVTEHFCDHPFVPETLNRLSATSENDLIIVGGGGVFMDYFTPFWEGLRAIARRVPLVIWGAGFCDLKREPSLASSALLQEVIGHSRLCIVRDELSRQLLDLPVPTPVPCPSLCASDLAVPAAQEHAVLHVDNYSTAGADVYEAMDAAARRLAVERSSCFRGTNNRIEPPTEAALARTLALYSAETVISSALHGCIIGVANGRKVLAVSGDRKLESFMRVAGLAEWVLDIDEVHRITDRLERLGEQSSVDEFVRSARRRNEAVAMQVRSIAAELDRQSV